MQIANLNAELSKGIRAKVGACIVTSNGVVLTGYNGTHTGADNSLEYVDTETGELITKPEVIHAELNCVLKAAKEGVSCKGATVYSTLSPCTHCAAMLVQVGVSKFFFKEMYRSDAGCVILRSSGIEVNQIGD
jgi:dCMP deaminase